MATTTDAIRKYLLEIDKDPNLTADDVRQKLLTFVDGLVQKDEESAPPNNEDGLPLQRMYSALIDETLDEIDENEQKYEEQLQAAWDPTPEPPLTEEEFEDDVPDKTEEFWTNIEKMIAVRSSSIMQNANV